MGGELNQVLKDWSSVKTRVALVFPEIYDIGLPNLGLAILYDILNREADVLAERVYVPWPDMQAALRQAGLPLYSLETHHALADFDLIGISLPYEQLFSNVLTLLDLGGLPLLSAARDERYPLVMAGGSAVFTATASGTGTFQQNGGTSGTARNISIRTSSYSDGTLTGWGTVLLIMQLIAFLQPIAFVTMVSGLHELAAADKKIWAMIGLLFAAAFMIVSGINYFIQMTVVRQSVIAGQLEGLAQYIQLNPGSPMFALVILSWGLFQGLQINGTNDFTFQQNLVQGSSSAYQGQRWDTNPFIRRSSSNKSNS